MKTTAPNRTYQICKRCVMDTSDPWITFNSEGFCNHCIDFFETRLPTIKSKEKDKSKLEYTFYNIKKRNKNKNYDVLVGISGGVDSSYVVLKAQEAGLRILALHMDNGWDAPIAIKNINKLTKLKNVDYKCEVLNWNNFRKIQRSFIESGLPDIELPTDIAIQSSLNKYAIKYNIKNILAGGNMSNEGILPSCWMYNPRDSFFAKSVIKNSGESSSIFEEIKFGFRDEISHRLFYRIRTLYPLNQINYDKELAKKELKKKIDWESPVEKHCESTYTRFCQLIYQPMRNKFDYRRAHLSSDICMNRCTRMQALNELAIKPWSKIDVESDLRFISYKLGYSVEELKSIMNNYPLWYKDFPNREKFLGFAYDIFRFITGRQKIQIWARPDPSGEGEALQKSVPFFACIFKQQ